MKNKKVHGGAVAGCVVIAIIITVLLSVGSGLVIMRNIFNEKFIAKTISSVRIEQLEIPITIEGEQYSSITDALVEQVNQSMETNLTEEDVKQFFDESGIGDFVGEKLALGIEAVMNGEEISIVTNEEIMGFLKDNEQLIEDTLDMEITQSDLDKVEVKLQELEIEEKFNTKVITTTINDTEISPVFELVNSLRKFFSVGMIVTVYVIIALLFVGVFFLNKRQLWFAGPYLGIPAIVIGTVNAVEAIVVKFASGFVPEEIGRYVQADIFNELTKVIVIIAVVHLVVGIAITVASAVVKKVFAKNSDEETNTNYVKVSVYDR